MMISQDLFARFQQRLTAAGGEYHLVEKLEDAADVIVTHSALEEQRLVVPPKFSERYPWGALLPLLEAKNIRIEEAQSSASVADAPAGLSHAELAVAETGSVLLAENSLEARVVSMLTLTHFVPTSCLYVQMTWLLCWTQWENVCNSSRALGRISATIFHW